jgi:hypothetical protein
VIDKLSYLGGIVDGEGCISIFKRSKYYVPSVKIANTNETLILFVKSILDEYEVPYSVHYSDR